MSLIVYMKFDMDGHFEYPLVGVKNSDGSPVNPLDVSGKEVAEILETKFIPKIKEFMDATGYESANITAPHPLQTND